MNTRAEFSCKIHLLLSWLLYIAREEDGPAGRAVFSFRTLSVLTRSCRNEGKISVRPPKKLWIPVRIIIQMPVFRLGKMECEVLQAAPLSHLLLGHLLLHKGGSFMAMNVG